MTVGRKSTMTYDIERTVTPLRDSSSNFLGLLLCHNAISQEDKHSDSQGHIA